jgi:hypothetical protein
MALVPAACAEDCWAFAFNTKSKKEIKNKQSKFSCVGLIKKNEY